MIGDHNIASDDFWLNIAAESIYNSPEIRRTAIENIQKIILWTFSLFSAGGFMLAVFGFTSGFDMHTLILLGIAYFFLTLAYYFSAEASFPIEKTFNPNEVQNIKTVFANAVKKGTTYFKRAAILTFIGFFFLALGVLVQLTFSKQKQSTVKSQVYPLLLSTSYYSVANNNFIPVTIVYEKNFPVEVAIENKDTITISNRADSEYIRKKSTVVLITDSSGVCFYSFPVHSKSLKAFAVTASITKEKKDSVFFQSVTKQVYAN